MNALPEATSLIYIIAVHTHTRPYHGLTREECNSIMWAASSEFGIYRRCEQRRFRLLIRAVSPEPPLLAHTSSESRGPFRQKARSLAPLNGWECAVKIVMTECSKTQIRLTRHM